MLAAYKTKTEVQLGAGIVMMIAGRFLAGNHDVRGVLGVILLLGGGVLFTWGCMNYAEGKGYSRWLGLLGIIACIGFAILVWLPDRHADE